MSKFIVEDVLEFIQMREFQGKIPMYVVENAVCMSELAFKTGFLECQDYAEEDFEDSPEPVGYPSAGFDCNRHLGQSQNQQNK